METHNADWTRPRPRPSGNVHAVTPVSPWNKSCCILCPSLPRTDPLCQAKGHTKMLPLSQLAHHGIPSSSPPSTPPEPPHHRHDPEREYNSPPRWPTPLPGVGRRPRPRPRRRRRGQRHHSPVNVGGTLAWPGRGQRQRRPHDGGRAGKGTRPHGVRRAPDGAVVVVGPKRRRPRARRSRRVGQVAVEVDASASVSVSVYIA